MPNKFYFDYAATTPVDPRVLKAMKPYWSDIYGNPSSLHWLGQKASAAIFEARRKIADLLGCDYKKIIFTGSATEANNLALRGMVKAFLHQRIANKLRINEFVNSKQIRNSLIKPKIIVSAIEHESILDTCRDLEKEGVEIVYLPVSKDGIVDLKKLKESLDERTILVSVMYANNEIGTIQPISEIAKIIRNFREGSGFRVKDLENNKKNLTPISYTLYPLLHTDAVQAFNYLDCDVNDLGVDLMTLSAHKIYGPKGIGLLYSKFIIQPLITGGGQEFGLRSGTENTAGIVGFSEAMALAQKERTSRYSRVKNLRDRLERGIFKNIPHIILNSHPLKRLPNFLNVSFLGIEGEALLLYLDQKGIFASTGSACSSRSLKPSHVLTAMGIPYKYIHGSIRFSFGKNTSLPEVNYVLKILPGIVKKLRQMSPMSS
jgi:cysteine desulfurase